jgi:7-cyano-7-deazaguanine synthase in queuosine biosynthesis
MSEAKKAIVPLRGGLDSATSLAIATSEGSFRYGGRGDACFLRGKGFAENGRTNPAAYQKATRTTV